MQATIPQKIQKSASLLESGDLQGASELLQEVLQENPNHGPAHLLLGQISLAQFKWSEAEQHLQIATGSQTKRPHLAWHLLGKLYLMRHEYAEAKRNLDQALKETADFQPALIDRARASLFLKDTESAIHDLQAAQESQEAKLLLAELLLYMNRDPQAMEILQPMSSTVDAAEWLTQKSKQTLAANLSNNLGNDAAYFALGLACLRDKETQQAETFFKIAYQLNDQNPVAWLFLKDKADDAPDLPHPHLMQKISEITNLLQQKNFIAAQTAGRELIAACRMCIPAYIGVIEAAEKTGDVWESLSHQGILLEWLGGIPSLHSRRANMAREIGAHQLAECSIRKAIALEPNNGSHYYLLSTIQQAQKQTDPALESCKKAIDLGYENAAVYITLGDLYYEKMLLSESIAALSKGIEMDPTAAENIASFALTALTTEDYKMLRGVLEKHAETHP
ncbi:MAG TPA: tetratricopeptide repeat protein, partial [Acidobacteriota bacterium]|nr:tetratricopeptide repeat protein [Acidobacteriota bacterium]